MQAFWKLAALAVGMVLFAATIQWVRSGADADKSDWLYSTRIDWLGLVDVLVTSSAVAVMLARGGRRRGRTLGVILAAGLVVTALVGMAMFTTIMGLDAVLLACC